MCSSASKDWWATHSGAPAVNAGLDVGSPSRLKYGRFTVSITDDNARRCQSELGHNVCDLPSTSPLAGNDVHPFSDILDKIS